MKYKLTREDAISILKGFLIVVGGAALTYLGQVITQIDFGVWSPAVVALASVLINVARKFLSGVEEKKE